MDIELVDRAIQALSTSVYSHHMHLIVELRVAKRIAERNADEIRSMVGHDSS